MQILASLLAAAVPILFYLFILWKLDRYEPEPVGQVIKHFLWGAFGAVIFGIVVSSFFLNDNFYIYNSRNVTSTWAVVLIAPFVEEFGKGIFLLWSIKNDYFDNMTDGMVYGGAVGLGFGMTENFLYFLMYNNNFENWLSIVIIRSLFSATMHAIASATFGSMLAIGKFSLTKFKKFFLPFFGFSSAVVFHALWNYLVSSDFNYLIGISYMTILIITFLSVYRFSLLSEKKIIINELEEEIYKINFPREHLSIVSSSKKFRRNWINNTIRKKYVLLATKLAFRKYQAKHSRNLKREYYLTDVEKYRYELSEIIKEKIVN